MADGRTLASGLRHVYPIKKDINHNYKLKGSDAMVYQSDLALGYEPGLYVYYEKRGAMIKKWLTSRAGPLRIQTSPPAGRARIPPSMYKTSSILGPFREYIEDDHFPEKDFWQDVEWVTPVTEFNHQTNPVALGYAGNEPAMDWAYIWSYALGKRVRG